MDNFSLKSPILLYKYSLQLVGVPKWWGPGARVIALASFWIRFCSYIYLLVIPVAHLAWPPITQVVKSPGCQNKNASLLTSHWLSIIIVRIIFFFVNICTNWLLFHIDLTDYLMTYQILSILYESFYVWFVKFYFSDT